MANTSWSSSSTRSSTPESDECPYMYDGSVWRQEYLTSNTRANLIAVTVINSVAAIPIIVLNMLIILAVAARRRLQTNSNILVAWLAGLDLSSGLVVRPIFIAQELKRIFSYPPYCTMEKASLVAIIGNGVTSLGILVLISIDRYSFHQISLEVSNHCNETSYKTWSCSGLVDWSPCNNSRSYLSSNR